MTYVPADATHFKQSPIMPCRSCGQRGGFFRYHSTHAVVLGCSLCGVRKLIPFALAWERIQRALQESP